MGMESRVVMLLLGGVLCGGEDVDRADGVLLGFAQCGGVEVREDGAVVRG